MKINRKQKELIKIYIVLFALIFIGINWNSVSWVFNYRSISGLVYDFFHPYENSALLVSADVAAPAETAVAASAQEKAYPYSEKNNSLEIPAIGITAPVVIGQSTQIPALEKDLDNGIVYYPGSVLPTQKGEIVLLGHSAPPGWPKIKYDWVFTEVNNLKEGDKIYLYFNNRQYTYSVTGKNIVQKGDDPSSGQIQGNENVLLLVSCWPPGKDYKRIVVEAHLVASELLTVNSFAPE